MASTERPSTTGDTMNTLTAEQVDTFRNMILEASENAAKWGDSDMIAALSDANLALASVLVLLQKEEGIAA